MLIALFRINEFLFLDVFWIFEEEELNFQKLFVFTRSLRIFSLSICDSSGSFFWFILK